MPTVKKRHKGAFCRLLHTLLAHSYFALPYPKSTGRELFSLNYLQSLLTGTEDPHDVLRTLIELTARSIVQEIKRTASDAQHIYVCGGGVCNHTLIASLQQQLPTAVFSTVSVGQLVAPRSFDYGRRRTSGTRDHHAEHSAACNDSMSRRKRSASGCNTDCAAASSRARMAACSSLSGNESPARRGCRPNP